MPGGVAEELIGEFGVDAGRLGLEQRLHEATSCLGLLAEPHVHVAVVTLQLVQDRLERMADARAAECDIVGAVCAHQQHAVLAELAGEVEHQPRGCGIHPVQIVEHEHERMLACDAPQELRVLLADTLAIELSSAAALGAPAADLRQALRPREPLHGARAQLREDGAAGHHDVHQVGRVLDERARGGVDPARELGRFADLLQRAVRVRAARAGQLGQDLAEGEVRVGGTGLRVAHPHGNGQVIVRAARARDELGEQRALAGARLAGHEDQPRAPAERTLQ